MLARAPWLALAASVLVGCAGSPAGERGDAALRFLAPVELGQPPIRSPEPVLAILDRDVFFIAALSAPQQRPNAAEGASWLWRSADAGAGWETIRGPARSTDALPEGADRGPFGSWDVDVRTSEDGWVYYTDWWSAAPPAPIGGTGPGNFLVERSSDGGVTWSSAPVTIPEPTFVDRQWILAGSDGLVGIFWASTGEPANIPAALGVSGPVMSIKAVFSRDHAATWASAQPIAVVPPEPRVSYQIGRPFATSEGILVLPYSRTAGMSSAGHADPAYWSAPTTIHAAVSRDDGATWGHAEVGSAPEGHDNLFAVHGAAAGADLHVAWAARAGASIAVSTTASRDQGATWSAPEIVSPPGLAVLPWIAATPMSQVTLEPVKLGPLCAKGNACEGNNELRDVLSIAFDPGGRLHVAWAVSVESGDSRVGVARFASEAADLASGAE